MQNDFSNYSSWFKPVDELTFADDFMFGKVMENNLQADDKTFVGNKS